jgi:hypothetical protein
MRRPLIALLLASAALAQTGPVAVSANHRYFSTSDGKPFFWLADTGWLLFQKLDRAEAEQYLENRRQKGFNVIQCMVLHVAAEHNTFGNAALIDRDPARPNLAGGEQNYWAHMDWIIDLAAKKGIYIALVPAWGDLAKRGQLNAQNVEAYSRFLATRYKDRENIFWMTGGDIQGDLHLEIWRTMGRTIRAVAPRQLITYHPFGRTQSSTWFHSEPWLDFNIFQSGHQDYAQDAAGKGEDNWRYVEEDYARQPAKPTLDGEPSYEGIPHGLHDPKQPYWTAADCRRYAYWSVFAGAAGHTYGHSSVMQMRKATDKRASYAPRGTWDTAIDAPGAGQMQYVKRLILSRPYFERIPDQTLVAGKPGQRYEHVSATRGRAFAFYYTFTGAPFTARLGIISGAELRAWWYNPRTGEALEIGRFPNRGERIFTPHAGEDAVLVLDDASAGFPAPGTPLEVRAPEIRK